MDEDDDLSISIDGVESKDLALTFKEQRAMRDLIRESVGDPQATVETVDLMDWVPALVCVVRRRENAEYTLDAALDTRLDDFVQPAVKKAGRRPTKATT